MSFLKNRTVLGAICIVLSLIICFALTPLFNQSVSQKTTVVRVVKDIQNGEQISKDMVQAVEVGGYNLPENVMTKADSVIGKYTKADLSPGDYILAAKLSDSPASENAYLYDLNGSKQAISVTIKSFAEGLSGKLASGDIVSVIAPDYKKQGSTVIPTELTYVEVVGVTASSGYDTDQADTQTDKSTSSNNEKQLPATVTLLVSPEQAKILAELDSEGKLHLSLIYRGTKDGAQKFLAIQDKLLEALYPKPSQSQSGTSTTGNATSTSSAAGGTSTSSSAKAAAANTAAESQSTESGGR
ncbi:MAG TPA: Flp pilus assembly protein CpaB [Methylomusa anaerophila]|jgi:pilus assembly protein CpaB|uniref:Flagellar basal body P-ring biosynthesis protein FlgA n=1 Tax=Methylomusa anaerophila TaxID=1930071 RepID=A0A348AMW0_9FIRM|nr:Flp pilus assembly protein CpaB [Methylomusa anaerophila]BBB92408.1 flagellar basal body P-ring biosynthesis protein FlgA [Methylomusa anaerophila]HML87740.1 Flp pilus assembly protein CpaB [Methylomusa anaerophila]